MNVPRVVDAEAGSAANDVFGSAGRGVSVATEVAALITVSLSEVGEDSGAGIKKEQQTQQQQEL